MDLLQFLYALAGQAFAAGAVYMAIRKDIVRALERAERAQETGDKAHQRIDLLMLRHD